MALPTFRAAGAKCTGTTALNPVTVTAPAGLAVGDLEILVVFSTGNASLDAAGSTNWTAMTGSPVAVASGGSLTIWWRINQSGDVAPQVNDSATTSIVGVRLAYTAGTFDATTPFEATATGTEAVSDTSFSFAPGTSTGGADRLVLVASTDNVANNTSQIPVCTNANLTALASRANYNSLNGGGFGVTEGARAASGAVGTFACTYVTASRKAYLSWAIRPTGTVTNQALTATAVVVTATLQNQVNKPMTTTSVVVTASLQRQIAKKLTATAVALTATLQKQVNKRMTTTAVTVTATLQALKVIVKTLTTTPVAVTATLRRQVNKNLTASSTVTATVQKQVSKRLTTTAVAVTATLTRLFPRTLSASVTVNAALTRRVNKNLTATPVAVTATLAKGSVFKQVLSAIVSTVATLTAKVVSTPNLHCTPVGSLTLAATGVGVISATCITPGVIALVCITPSGLTLVCITPGSIPLSATEILHG